MFALSRHINDGLTNKYHLSSGINNSGPSHLKIDAKSKNNLAKLMM